MKTFNQEQSRKLNSALKEMGEHKFFRNVNAMYSKLRSIKRLALSCIQEIVWRRISTIFSTVNFLEGKPRQDQKIAVTSNRPLSMSQESATICQSSPTTTRIQSEVMETLTSPKTINGNPDPPPSILPPFYFRCLPTSTKTFLSQDH